MCTTWARDMGALAHLLIDRFYSPEENLFFVGALEGVGAGLPAQHRVVGLPREAGRLTGDEQGVVGVR